MLDHCTYDKIKLLHELSSLAWFIEQHAKKDASSDKQFQEVLQKLSKDFSVYIHEIKKLV